MATCKMYKTPWFMDHTNFDPTYALRNAIRKVVANQDDLPAALRKDKILALSERGVAFRTMLLEEVNARLSECTFKRDPFTGTLIVEFWRSLQDAPDRVLQHFIPALVRVFKSGKVQAFVFLGVGGDKASSRAVDRFRKQEYKLFNILGVSFRRINNLGEKKWTFTLTPENPRRRLRKAKVEVTVPEGPEDTWRLASFAFPPHWWMPWGIDVRVLKNHHYYFRHFSEQYDAHFIEKFGTSRMKTEMKRGIEWARGFPKILFPVLCHREESGQPNNEVVDSIPHFRINLNPDVQVMPHGQFDLGGREQKWVELKMEELIMT